MMKLIKSFTQNNSTMFPYKTLTLFLRDSFPIFIGFFYFTYLQYISTKTQLIL